MFGIFKKPWVDRELLKRVDSLKHLRLAATPAATAAPPTCARVDLAVGARPQREREQRPRPATPPARQRRGGLGQVKQPGERQRGTAEEGITELQG